MGSYLTAFLVGGLICLIGQLLFDLTSWTPAHVLVLLVVAGGILGGLGLYEPLIKFAGAGATIPISSFGNALVKGAMAEAARSGPIGILTGIFELTSAGITASIIFGFFFALLFDPKG
ncbi:MAG TPA: stage V sporulation protein AE [Bacillota bacterium]|nr:stage V sporulation protein AE [Bacillota bacterium]HPZ89762.1 stage V sporulation protein AE [Bacillota bacterium]HQE01222.1 stage V sporulation protein AE [Bacillota bacterium]